MDPPPERLQDLMKRYGFTEQEARIAVHLEEAENLLTALERERYPGTKLGYLVWTETHVREHFRALHRRLGLQVLRRDYPEGWGYVPPQDDD